MSRKSILTVFVSLTLIVIVVSLILWRSFFSPVNISGEGVNIYIPPGAGYEEVKDTLRTNGILVNEKAFDILSERKRYNSNVKPGRYVITDKMSNNDILNLLKSGGQTPVRITFNNIRTPAELSGRLGEQLALDSVNIHNTLLNESLYSNEGFKSETIIAAFIPDTYEVYWTINAGDLIDRMIREFRSFWDKEKLKKAEEAGLSPVEVSTLASIVDDEVLKEDEKPKIAGVYINRLHRNMPLQACPTIKFALNDFTIRRVLNKHLDVDSPYNTYMHTGLPPGPVRCASKSGLLSVLNFEDHNYLYFVARHDFSGYHHFSTNLRDHLNYANKYQMELNRKQIYN